MVNVGQTIFEHFKGIQDTITEHSNGALKTEFLRFTLAPTKGTLNGLSEEEMKPYFDSLLEAGFLMKGKPEQYYRETFQQEFVHPDLPNHTYVTVKYRVTEDKTLLDLKERQAEIQKQIEEYEMKVKA